MVAAQPSGWRCDRARSPPSTGDCLSSSVSASKVALWMAVSAGSVKKRNGFSTRHVISGSLSGSLGASGCIAGGVRVSSCMAGGDGASTGIVCARLAAPAASVTAAITPNRTSSLSITCVPVFQNPAFIDCPQPAYNSKRLRPRSVRCDGRATAAMLARRGSSPGAQVPVHWRPTGIAANTARQGRRAKLRPSVCPFRGRFDGVQKRLNLFKPRPRLRHVTCDCVVRDRSRARWPHRKWVPAARLVHGKREQDAG